MNNKPKTKLLTISLLCCGRPETTEACLKSIMPIREKVDSEIQVVDTGCTKETREIVEKYADEIFEFTWCNDFSAARNIQIDNANGEWLLYLDDDEYFEKTDEIIDLFTSGKYKKYGFGGYVQRNYVEADGSEYRDVRVGRLTKINPNTEFRGKVHEYIANETGDAIYLDDYVGHYGYCYTTEEENIKHAKRNIPLLMEMMEEEPDQYRWPYQLAQEYRACKEFDKLYKLETDMIAKIEKQNSIEHIRYLSSFICGRTIAQEALGYNEELVRDYKNVLLMPNVYENAKARVSLYASRVYKINENYEMCREACMNFLKLAEFLDNNPAQKFIQDGIFLNDTFDENHFNLAYSYLVICGFHEGDIGPLMKYYQRITWDRPRLNFDPELITGLIAEGYRSGNEAGINKVFDKCFSRPPIKGFIEAEIRRTAPGLSVEDIKRLSGCFKNTRCEKEMKLFAEVRALEVECMKRQWICFMDIKTAVEKYNSLLEEWYKLHVMSLGRPADSTDETADLKVSRKLVEFFRLCEQDTKEALKILKEAVGMVPIMDSTIQSASRLLGERQKVLLAKEENPEKFQEMYTLEEAVRSQIAELEANGHGADAATTRGQLEAIIMQTYGVKSLH